VNENLTCALTYAARGRLVMWAPPNRKPPTFSGWLDLATTDVTTVTNRFAGHSERSVATRATSSIFVLDLDDTVCGLGARMPAPMGPGVLRQPPRPTAGRHEGSCRLRGAS
jgi:Bifunctional DNA primase/polymerase, N-terminal